MDMFCVLALNSTILSTCGRTCGAVGQNPTVGGVKSMKSRAPITVSVLINDLNILTVTVSLRFEMYKFYNFDTQLRCQIPASWFNIGTH